MAQSIASSLAGLPKAEQEGILARLGERSAVGLRYDWKFWGRSEQFAPEGDWDVWLVLAGRGFGKLLCNDTVIPTPSGWTTMGDISVGAEVFDEAGKRCRVTAKFSPRVDEQYRVSFSDGSSIDACADHQWVTFDASTRQALRNAGVKNYPLDWPQWRSTRGKCARVLTTSQIKGSLDARPGYLNHSIPVAGPLILPESPLIVDPFILGLWLGDGSASSGSARMSADRLNGDQALIRSLIVARGYETSTISDPTSFGVLGLGPDLARMGLIAGREAKKSVPLNYLRASIAQRLDLLRGLMITDGTITAAGQVCFENTNENLIDAVVELAASLAQKPAKFKLSRLTVAGKTVWRVNWSPTIDVFGVGRKSDHIRLNGAQSIRNHHRVITAAERIAPVPMSCITVNSPNSMYLVGKAMIPTHNTRTGAEWLRETAKSGKVERFALIAQTAADARDVMVEGPSGILAISPPSERPIYESSKRRLSWPNGSTAIVFNATEPDALRGPQVGAAWLDELAKFSYLDETWSNLQFGLREGDHPRAMITTTPRPLKILRDLIASKGCVVTRGRTRDNEANLAPSFLRTITEKYGGTRLGRQELDAEILDDVPGALWTRAMIDEARKQVQLPSMVRIVVAIDPSGVRSEDDMGRDEVGIVVAGRGVDGRGYILADRSCRLTPAGWGQRAIRAYYEFKADRLVAEANYGGAMVKNLIEGLDHRVAYQEVNASRGKVVRAEPISALYEKGQVTHVAGDDMSVLEDQMCQMASDGYAGDGSPDRVDALVWALTACMLQKPQLLLTGGLRGTF